MGVLDSCYWTTTQYHRYESSVENGICFILFFFRIEMWIKHCLWPFHKYKLNNQKIFYEYVYFMSKWCFLLASFPLHSVFPERIVIFSCAELCFGTLLTAVDVRYCLLPCLCQQPQTECLHLLWAMHQIGNSCCAYIVPAQLTDDNYPSEYMGVLCLIIFTAELGT